LIALVFTAIAVVIGRRRPEPINLSELASMIRSSEGVAETDRASDKAKPAASPSSSEIDSALDVVRLFAKSPKTGIEPIDNLIRAVEPRAEEVAREAAQRAATLVQTGNRKTMIAILGAAAATGWLIAKSGSLAGKQVVTDGDNPNKSS
ncbi:MAG: hypothetical protein WBZ08_09265, partial [Pseudolabrys sp.]